MADDGVKSAAHAEILLEQNKVLKSQVSTLHRQANMKDIELSQAQAKVQDYEKRFVLLQKNAKDAQLI